jgi:predicted ATPase
VLGIGADGRSLLVAARARTYNARRDTGDGDAARGHVVPVPPTALVGRERELVELRRRLLHEQVRLLTLTGTGGTGKTRLALAVASELCDSFEHGVWFVDLTAIREPGLVLAEIARVLGVHHESRHPIREALEHFLRNKQLLLILDNCEQVVAAAPEIGALLERCRHVQVVATSREPLRLRSERLFPVPPLGLPPEDATQSLMVVAAAPAVALFIQRSTGSAARLPPGGRDCWSGGRALSPPGRPAPGY